MPYTMIPEHSVTRQAHLGLKRAMIGLNTLLIVTGIILMTLGAQINQHLTPVGTALDGLPQLWCLGLMPLLIGVLGIVCLLIGKRKWIGAWLGFSSVLGVAAFVFFSLTGCLDSDTYGVTVHIFGDCVQHDNICKCAWADGSRFWVLEDSSCDKVKLVSILYVILIVIFVLCLTTTVICATLGCVLACCLKLCIPKQDPRLEMHAINYEAHGKALPSSSSYYSHRYLLVPPIDFTSSRSDGSHMDYV